MAVLVTCGGCRREFRAKDRLRGASLDCPECHDKVTVEGPRVPDHDVFISHSNKDKAVADAVCAAFESSQLRCWMAPRDITVGNDWSSSIVEAINNSSVMVLIFSSNSNMSKQVLREVERAVAKGVAILPFRIDAVDLSKSLEYFLSACHWSDAQCSPLDESIATLCRQVKLLLQAAANSGGDSSQAVIPAGQVFSQSTAVDQRTLHRFGKPIAFGVIVLMLGIAIALLARLVLNSRSLSPPAPFASATPAQLSPPVLAEQTIPRATAVSTEAHGLPNGTAAAISQSPTVAAGQTGTLCVMFNNEKPADGNLEIFVNGKRVGSIVDKSKDNILRVRVDLRDGDFLLFRAKSRLTFRSLRFAYLSRDNRVQLVSQASATRIRIQSSPSEPVAAETFSAPPADQGIYDGNQQQQWLNARLPDSAEWIRVPQPRGTYEIELTVSLPAAASMFIEPLPRPANAAIAFADGFGSTYPGASWPSR